MDEPRTWRELLRRVINDPIERQRIAHALDMNPITLTRWVNETSTPRSENMRRLLNALPQHRSLLLRLISEDFPEFSNGLSDTQILSEEIPATFYARVLNAYTSAPHLLRFSSICTLILQQALEHLDPKKQGMSITMMQCMPPSRDDKICSLREIMGSGTPPWRSHLEHQTMFLGAESLAGYTVTSCRLVTIQSRSEKQNLFPVHWVDDEKSAAACPILLNDCTAGCLHLSSSRPDYFTSSRRELIQRYADLLVLAFEQQEFYDLESIELRIMPSYEVQQSYLAQFQQRVTKVLIQAARDKQAMTRIQAEQVVWRQLEEELLDYA
jgi:hypothetical protein